MAPLWIVIAFTAGLVLATQAGFNVSLAEGSGGPIWGAFLSFLVGTLAFALLLAALRAPLPRVSSLTAMPPSAWLGGICGGVYVLSVILISPRLGLAATMALVVAGQTLGAMLLDHFGLLGFPVHPIGAMRVLGAALLVGGVALIRAF